MRFKNTDVNYAQRLSQLPIKNVSSAINDFTFGTLLPITHLIIRKRFIYIIQHFHALCKKIMLFKNSIKKTDTKLLHIFQYMCVRVHVCNTACVCAFL